MESSVEEANQASNHAVYEEHSKGIIIAQAHGAPHRTPPPALQMLERPPTAAVRMPGYQHSPPLPSQQQGTLSGAKRTCGNAHVAHICAVLTE
jgi:hypothetical protein